MQKVTEPLGDDEIHVWWLGYRRELGRAPLRAILASYLDEPADALVLHDDAHGRPELAPPHAGLYFNWSHSGDRAVVAVARGIRPGIDLERLRPRRRSLDLAHRFFSTAEALALARLAPALLDPAFLALWTAKEAVLKATGRGLAFGLDRLEFTVLPEPLRLLRLDEDAASAWQVHPLACDSAHVGTLAWRGPPRRIRSMTLAERG
ncbi:4'-phosphopantetheinyl transferase family protein [Dyella sp. A6]|uniref:4'-phosphopantetheinyl transferase family protein n=1 Tax=Dyella aluminiiresistens TaxID=3069105 RepID=UPI002E771F15|nr:4'-phosphopantetheinyl transferase superfamily protein [Dyella sp. A6]